MRPSIVDRLFFLVMILVCVAAVAAHADETDPAMLRSYVALMRQQRDAAQQTLLDTQADVAVTRAEGTAREKYWAMWCGKSPGCATPSAAAPVEPKPDAAAQ